MYFPIEIVIIVPFSGDIRSFLGVQNCVKPDTKHRMGKCLEPWLQNFHRTNLENLIEQFHSLEEKKTIKHRTCRQQTWSVEQTVNFMFNSFRFLWVQFVAFHRWRSTKVFHLLGVAWWIFWSCPGPVWRLQVYNKLLGKRWGFESMGWWLMISWYCLCHLKLSLISLGQWLNFKLLGIDYVFSRTNKVQTFISGSIGYVSYCFYKCVCGGCLIGGSTMK